MSDAKPIIAIRDVTKRFGTVVAVDEVSLDVRPGEFLALLGPSGCGKTTLLRMLAGFETPSEGEILIDGQDMSQVPPNRRPVNMVFQSYAVFPHMTVADNVAYGLKVVGTPASEIRPRVEEALRMVQLADFGDRKPDQLSGGQRQRVALARALIKKPKVLLLDEPLSALDAKLREAMRLELVRLQHSIGITFIIVTHDQEEALSMADRIAVMHNGRVQQVAPPSELYEFPNSRFVADFIGRINLLDGTVDGFSNGVARVEIPGLPFIDLPNPTPLAGTVSLAVRPEKIQLSQQQPSNERIHFQGRVAQIAYYGGDSHVFLECADNLTMTARIQNEERTIEPVVAVGDQLWLSWKIDDTLILNE